MGVYTTIDPATGEQSATVPGDLGCRAGRPHRAQRGGVPLLADHAVGAAPSRADPSRRDPP